MPARQGENGSLKIPLSVDRGDDSRLIAGLLATLHHRRHQSNELESESTFCPRSAAQIGSMRGLRALQGSLRVTPFRQPKGLLKILFILSAPLLPINSLAVFEPPLESRCRVAALRRTACAVCFRQLP